MTYKVHRDGDQRDCEGKTTVREQKSVYVNDKLWAVKTDQDDHLDGQLKTKLAKNVYVEDKLVAVKHDTAEGDRHNHQEPRAREGSDDVYAGGDQA